MTDISERLEDDRRIVRIAGVYDDGSHQELLVDFDGTLRVCLYDIQLSQDKSLWVHNRAFCPWGETVALGFSTASARVRLSQTGLVTPAETLKIHNPTDHLVFVRLGDAGVVAQIPDYPILPHGEVTLRRKWWLSHPETHVAAIAEAGTGTIYLTLGDKYTP